MKSELEIAKLLELAQEAESRAFEHQDWNELIAARNRVHALQDVLTDENHCPYTFAHTRHWCGYKQCRDA